MAAMNGVTETLGSQGATAASAGCYSSGGLAAFLDRANLCGDITETLLSLTCQDDTLSSATQRKQLHVQRRLVNDAHLRRQKELEKYYRALKKSSFWSKVGKIFGGIVGALAAGLSIAGVAAWIPLAVGLAGTLGAGGAKCGAAEWNRKATNNKAKQLMAQLTIDQGKQLSDQLVADIQKAAEIEATMISRLAKLADSERQLGVK